MVKSYLKVAFRNSKKNPVYTFINISGLAVGIACCIIIALYVMDELSYDTHHPDSERIYRVTQATIVDNEENRSSKTAIPLRDAILRDFPSFVETGARFFDFDTEKVSVANPENREIIRHDRFFFTDPEALEIFDIEIVRGNPAGGLDEPNSVVITERVAELYFGDDDPIGKELIFEGRVRLNVTAVMKEWHRNSHFKADMLTSFETLRGLWGIYDEMTSRWRWNPLWTYIRLADGADASALETQLKEYHQRYYAEYFSENETIDLELQPLTDIWLHSNLTGEIEPVSSAVNVYLFSIIAVLILTIACINFINLSTAGAMYRSKEVGLRKVMGAERSGLVFQFLMEALIYTVTALLLALLIVWFVLPEFSSFMDRSLDPGVIGTGSIIGLLFLLVISIAALSGFYPTAILSSFNPIDSLRGRLSAGKSGGRMRRGLVVFQFAITAFLLIATSIAWLQYQLLQQQDMGFDREQVLVVPVSMTSAIWEYDTFRERALEHSAILSISGSQTLLGGTARWKYDVTPEGYAEGESPSLAKMFVMHDFLETMNIPLLAGRDFSREFSTDPAQAVVINRAMVEHLDWESPEEALGKTFRISGSTRSVVGVTENFNFIDLRQELEPLIMELPDGNVQLINNIDYMKIRLAAGHPGDAIDHLSGVWSDVDRTHLFDWFFLDDRLNQIYRTEQLLTSVLTIFAIIAIIIGCLGLLGLTAYSVNRRRREIAIRKTLGLSAAGVFALLSKDYLKLILYAHLIALPLVFLATSRWLETFAHSIDLGYYIAVTFVLSLVISISISLITISTQSVKAALMNPAMSLRSE
jgi:putative ABC transport system permease protein